MMGSGIFFAVARDGLFPFDFASIRIKYHTPAPVLIFMVILTPQCFTPVSEGMIQWNKKKNVFLTLWQSLVSFMYTVTGDVHILIKCQGITLNITCVLISVSVLYLKRKKPLISRPILVSAIKVMKSLFRPLIVNVI